VDFIRSIGSQDNPEGRSKDEMEAQKSKEKFDVGFIIDNDIIQNKGKKENGYPNERDQDSLTKFPQTAFTVYFTIGTNQNIKNKPEYRNNQ
jgi:hypothetical protein